MSPSSPITHINPQASHRISPHPPHVTATAPVTALADPVDVGGGDATHGDATQGDAARGVAAVARMVAATRRQPPPTARVLPAADNPAARASRPLRIGAYCRYSTHAQDRGYSIEEQHTALLREAATRAASPTGEAWDLRWYDEPATSAFTEDVRKRPVFLRLLRDAAAGELDAVAVLCLDRFARRSVVHALAFRELEAAGVGFISLLERMDFTTPAGRLMMHQIAAFAEYDSGHKGERTQGGKRVRAERGLTNNRAPYGYRVVAKHLPAEPDRAPTHATPDRAPDAHGAAHGAVDPEGATGGGTWEGLQLLFRLALTGVSDGEIADALNAAGYRLHVRARTTRAGRLFTHASVYQMRRNPYYCPFQPGDDRGTIVHHGRARDGAWEGEARYRGQHLAAVTWEEWHAVQHAARDRRRGVPATHASARAVPFTAEFRQIAVCAECGGRLHVTRDVGRARDGGPGANTTADTPDAAETAETARVTYERYICMAHRAGRVCASARRWASVTDVRAAWVAWARDALTFPPAWEARLRAHLATPLTAFEDTAGARERERERERRRYEEQKRRARTAYLELQAIDDAEFARLTREAEAALARLDAEAQPLEPRVRRLRAAGEMVRGVADAWGEMTTDERIQLASALLPPGGLRVRVRGARGAGVRWDGTGAPSGTLESVTLREPFAELASLRLVFDASEDRRDGIPSLHNN